MPLVLNVPEFWINQGSKCASGFEYARIIPELYQNIPELYQNIPEYTRLYQNVPEF